MITLQELKSSPLINTFIEKGNEHLGVMGYTDHGKLHLSLVSALSKEIMLKLGYGERLAELAGMAGYIHDIGNVVNRNGHSQSGALMAMEILGRMGMDAGEVAIISAAIGNHDEGSGHPVNEVAAALILADKSHVHRNRVRNTDIATFDIHDRVNYAVEHSILNIDEKQKVIAMDLVIDTKICPVMEYFEIFMSRMLLCRRAASFLDCEFELL
ncbi:MAG: HD domain-containing protein, partial [Syntrophomonas sp.]